MNNSEGYMKIVVAKGFCLFTWVLVSYPIFKMLTGLIPVFIGRTVGCCAYNILDLYWKNAWHFSSSWAVIISMILGFAFGFIIVFNSNSRFLWRWSIFPFLIFAYVVWLGEAYRVWGLVTGAIAFVIHIQYCLGRVIWGKVMRTWLVAVILCIVPFDISLQNYPGWPHFVPLRKGRASQKSIAAEKRGEIMLGGCCVSLFDPSWVLVW